MWGLLLYGSSYFNENTGEFDLVEDEVIGKNIVGFNTTSTNKYAYWVVGDKSTIYISKYAIKRSAAGEDWLITCENLYWADEAKSYKKGDKYYGIVGSTNSEEYPQNGYKDGFWYEKTD